VTRRDGDRDESIARHGSIRKEYIVIYDNIVDIGVKINARSRVISLTFLSGIYQGIIGPDQIVEHGYITAAPVVRINKDTVMVPTIVGRIVPINPIVEVIIVNR
jgi:hypothetical protein